MIRTLLTTENPLIMHQITTFITNHWPLCLALVIIVTIILINEILNKKQQGKTLSTAQAIDLINHHDAVIFDLRPQEAYLAGHIISALHILEDDLPQPRLNKYKQKPVILVCARGNQSAQCAAKMLKLGFTQPIILEGGMSAWQLEQLPVVKGKK